MYVYWTEFELCRRGLFHNSDIVGHLLVKQQLFYCVAVSFNVWQFSAVHFSVLSALQYVK